LLRLYGAVIFRERFFNGQNASTSPLLAIILAIFGLEYTVDYQSSSILWSMIEQKLNIVFSFTSSITRRHSARVRQLYYGFM
jgi:hypothetical protein